MLVISKPDIMAPHHLPCSTNTHSRTALFLTHLFFLLRNDIKHIRGLPHANQSLTHAGTPHSLVSLVHVHPYILC